MVVKRTALCVLTSSEYLGEHEGLIFAGRLRDSRSSRNNAPMSSQNTYNVSIAPPGSRACGWAFSGESSIDAIGCINLPTARGGFPGSSNELGKALLRSHICIIRPKLNEVLPIPTKLRPKLLKIHQRGAVFVSYSRRRKVVARFLIKISDSCNKLRCLR